MKTKVNQSKIERWPIDKLKSAPYNPRKIKLANFHALKESIKRYGHALVVPVNIRTGYIVGGHMTVKALKELGYTEVDVKLLDLDDSEERALNITLNNQHSQGTFSDDLDAIIADLSKSFDGFADLQLNRLYTGDLSLEGNSREIDTSKPSHKIYFAIECNVGDDKNLEDAIKQYISKNSDKEISYGRTYKD